MIEFVFFAQNVEVEIKNTKNEISLVKARIDELIDKSRKAQNSEELLSKDERDELITLTRKLEKLTDNLSYWLKMKREEK